MVVHRHWNTVVAPDGLSRGLTINWKLIGLAPPRRTIEDTARCELTLPRALDVANALRRYVTSLALEDDFDLAAHGHLKRLIQTMDQVSKDMDPETFARSLQTGLGRSTSIEHRGTHNVRYGMAHLMNCFLMADALRSDADLKRAFQLSIDAIIPQSLRGSFVQLLNEQEIIPSKNCISRTRLVIDVAYMLLQRERYDAGEWIHILMADSSVQMNRHFMLVLVLSIASEKLVEIYRAAKELAQLRRTNDYMFDESATLRREKELMVTIQAALRLRRCPPITMAPGRGTLGDKFHAVAHALHLIASATNTGFAAFIKDVVINGADLGTEYALPLVEPVPLKDIFPYQRPELTNADFSAGDADDFDDIAAARPALALNFENAIPTTDLMHVIHNAANDIFVGDPLVEETVDEMARIVDLLLPENKERLIETCFDDEIGRTFAPLIRKFTGQVYKARWGSVAWCAKELRKIIRPLQMRFTLSKYFGTNGKHKTLNQGTESSKRIIVADAAIRSPYFEGRLIGVDMIFTLVREAFAFSEGCDCHSHLDWEAVPHKIRQLWSQCPCRGFRLTSVCSGEFFDLFGSVANVTTGILMGALPTELEPTQFARIVQMFENSRSKLMFTFTLKLCPMLEPPRSLCGLAHHDIVVVRRLLARGLSSDCPHPRIRELQAEPLRSEAQAVIDGALVESHRKLESYISRFRWGFSSLRRLEAGHGQIKLKTRVSGRSETFDSLALRMPEIKQLLLEGQQALPDLIRFMSIACSPAACATALGFRDHPLVPTLHSNWSKEYRKIIYRADAYTLYHAPRLSVTVGPGPPDAPSAGDIPAIGVAAPPEDNSAAALAPLEDTSAAAPSESNQQLAIAFPAIDEVTRPFLCDQAALTNKDDVLAKFWHEAALDQLSLLMEDSDKNKHIFSCPIVSGSVKTLVSLFTQAGLQDFAFSWETASNYAGFLGSTSNSEEDYTICV